tara:strand:+ start:1092 stop:1880 length:789 start_codon:yes stop_codon:yes gene_type:complete
MFKFLCLSFVSLFLLSVHSPAASRCASTFQDPAPKWNLPKRGSIPKKTIKVINEKGETVEGHFVGKFYHEKGQITDARIRKEIREDTGKAFQTIAITFKGRKYKFDLLSLLEKPKNKLKASELAALEKYQKRIHPSNLDWIRTLISIYREINLQPTTVEVHALRLVVAGKEYFLRAGSNDEIAMAFIAKSLGLNGTRYSNGPYARTYEPGTRGQIFENDKYSFTDYGRRFEVLPGKDGPYVKLSQLQRFAYEYIFVDFFVSK